VTPAPDHARLRDELAAIDRRMNAHLSCLLRGEPVPVVAVLEDGLRLFGLAAELLDRVGAAGRQGGDSPVRDRRKLAWTARTMDTFLWFRRKGVLHLVDGCRNLSGGWLVCAEIHTACDGRWHTLMGAGVGRVEVSTVDDARGRRMRFCRSCRRAAEAAMREAVEWWAAGSAAPSPSHNAGAVPSHSGPPEPQ
jgi:hypothetical protein